MVGTWTEVIREIVWDECDSLHSLFLHSNEIQWKTTKINKMLGHKIQGAFSPHESNSRISVDCDKWQRHQESTRHYAKPPRSWGHFSSLFWPVHISTFQILDQVPPQLWIIPQLFLQTGCHTSLMRNTDHFTLKVFLSNATERPGPQTFVSSLQCSKEAAQECK